MSKFPIVLVEDDKDDCEFIINALSEIGVTNEIRCFASPITAIEYLRNTSEIPFIIISDINMPGMNGLAFKRFLNDDALLNAKRIPFVFLSTSAASYLVDEAFNLCVQGYFQKPTALNEYGNIAKAIIEYWKNSKLPHALNN
ncbi:MAG: response regulator [Ferruginibacter sp.]